MPLSLSDTGQRVTGEAAPFPTGRGEYAERLLGGVTLAFAGVMLAIALSRFAGGPPRTLAWFLYGASSILMLLALPSIDGRWSDLARRVRSASLLTVSGSGLVQMGVLILVLVIVLLVRAYDLHDLPAGLYYDEANNLHHANLFQQDPSSIPVFIPSTNLLSLFPLPVSVLIRLRDITPTAGRLVAVAFGLSGVVAMFLLARMALGPVFGLVAAFLTDVMHWEISWSRIGMRGSLSLCSPPSPPT